MKKILTLALTFAFVTLVTGTATAETDTTSHNVTITVNDVALIDVVPGDVTFEIGATGGEAGEPFYVGPNNGTDHEIGYDNDTYLQYTSIVADTGYVRKVTVHIDSADNIPEGYKLYVKAAAAATAGSGNLGTAHTNPIDLGTNAEGLGSAVTFVTDVGSGYTGDGATDGVNLIYELEMIEGSAGSLYVGSYQALVTYTLTASAAEGT
jgi:hypothetical protein